MTGRGVDQILPFPSNPSLHEDYIKNAKNYISIAEKVNGPIPRSVSPQYIWGEALDIFKKIKPDTKIINLETSITTSEDWQDKGINYRMHPKNVSCLTSADIGCCVLSNNHILDWGSAGLKETLEVLKDVGINTAGAGLTIQDACKPAILSTNKNCKIIVFGFGSQTSGISPEWAASEHTPGINFLENLSTKTTEQIKIQIKATKTFNDIVIASIHWGGNWGYEIPEYQRNFARYLIDEADVDIIHGHSSHHAKAIEIYKEKLILYGCGDLITDYEGIRGNERYRGDLGIMYFANIECATGKLHELQMIPMKTKKFRLEKASEQDLDWLVKRLNHEEMRFRTKVIIENDSLILR